MRSVWGFDELPARLRHYVVAVSLLGPLFCLLLFKAGWSESRTHEFIYAAILVAFAALAESFPLHLTNRTSINVAGAAYVAMILLLPPSYPGLLALVAAGTANFLRWRRDRSLPAPEQFFNTAQTGFYVACAALVYALMTPQLMVPSLGSIASISAIAGLVVSMHLVNTLLVATAAAIQLGTSPLRVWWRNIALDLTPQVTLTIVGTVAAVLAVEQPFVLLLLILPGIFVQRAVGQTIRLRTETHEALASLVEVIELRDPYTAGHSRRVATTARLIAERMELTQEEIDLIESAGRVHDIGKVAVDPAVLMKPGVLTPGEWEQMKPHPVYGAHVVERFAAYQNGAKLVRHHHERWDGRGYPDGLAGLSIPLGARILAVADTFDALTSDRPYRAGLDVATAMRILRDGRGTQWDPRIVDELCALIAERPGEVPVCARYDNVVEAPITQLQLLDVSSIPAATDAPAEKRPA